MIVMTRDSRRAASCWIVSILWVIASNLHAQELTTALQVVIFKPPGSKNELSSVNSWKAANSHTKHVHFRNPHKTVETFLKPITKPISHQLYYHTHFSGRHRVLSTGGNKPKKEKRNETKNINNTRSCQRWHNGSRSYQPLGDSIAGDCQ